MRTLPALSFVTAALIAITSAWADDASPVGLWKNIDDVTGKPAALIRISDNQGELQGTVEKVFYTTPQAPKCTKCEGANKNQPIEGMLIVWGLKKDGDEYSGGSILDPSNGKVYRSKLQLTDGGRKMHVRGYIGTPLFGRSQTWIREE